MSTISRPSRAALSLRTNPDSDSDVTLGSLMRALRESRIPGPFQLTECHTGSKALGAGAQFDVFGKRIYIESTFPDFDRPCLNDPQKCWPGALIDHRLDYVAIKRPKFRASEATPGLVRLSTTGFVQKVSKAQLSQTHLEVLALCHTPLRRHANIVKLLAWGYDRPASDLQVFSPVLLVECALCSLETLSSWTLIPWAVKQHLCAGMVNGVAALHECRIIHGDIKPANVLVFASAQSQYSCVAKVSDFGLCLHDFESSSKTEISRGTVGWSAPELQHLACISSEDLPKCDIWSLGATIWSVMTERGTIVNTSSIQSRTVALSRTFDAVAMPVELQEIISHQLSEMLLEDPASRCITAATVYSKITQKTVAVSGDELGRYERIVQPLYINRSMTPSI